MQLRSVDTPRKARYSNVGSEQRAKNSEQSVSSADLFFVLLFLRFAMDDLELSTAELPAAMQAWIDSQPAVVVSIERGTEDRVIVRALPGITPELLARIQVTMAQYREALMNLT
jgi:hypothetical protein